MGTASRVAIVSTGDELVLGTTLDTNAGAIARTLAALGYEPASFLVLGDDEEALADAVTRLSADHAAIVITGGLGPTLDDVTRHAVARAAGVVLVQDARVLAELRALFASRGRTFLPANERQALFPAGSTVLDNPGGTAPGFALALGGALVVALPGPPREMLPMLEGELVPRLLRNAPRAHAVAARALHLFGLAESALAEELGAAMHRGANPLVGVTAKDGVLSVTVRATAATAAEAEALAGGHADALARRFPAQLFSRDEPDLARVLGAELRARRVSIALAESCTGGLLAARLTSVPGISAVFGRGWVTYANAAKVEELGVPAELLERHGAVSGAVACAMAAGAARRANARLALAITGVAGPDGGTPEKPVGLVWFGVAIDGVVHAEERRFVARERELIRALAVNTALDLGRRALSGLSGDAAR
ncbi:MAG: competence/damage-inducible protein A [Planctomycetes bacterium]|nr:competence/damage-inducible protein A [Planctomycetota bacterium]